MATLKFHNVNKIYDNNVHAVYDFNLDVKDKEFIVFVGPSGCGKSTTLRMIAGLEDISTGELYIDGKLVNYISPKDRHIAMVFQSYALYPHMTVYRNMAFGLTIRKTYREVYNYNEECKDLIKLSAAKRKEYKKVSKLLSKGPDNEEYLKQEETLREELLKIYENIFELRTPVIGRDEVMIKVHQKDNKKCQKELIKMDKMLEKEQALSIEKRNDLLIENIKNDIAYKEKQIKHNNDEITFLESNSVNIKSLRHMQKFEIDYQVLKAAKTLDLEKYLSRKPAELSGGQRQRVALGRAIVRHPKVFLMDEPLSNLDAKLRVQTRSEIARIHKSVGATTIYVTHDQTEAMTLADRIVIMKDGYIQQIGTPKQCYNEPENMFVGGFIGSPAMNFLKGTLMDNYFVIDDKNKIKLDDKCLKLLKDYQNKELYLGSRPEDIKVYKKDGNFSNGIKSDISEYELLGHDFIYFASIGNQKFSIKTDVSHEIEDYKKGTKVYFDLDKLNFFDKDSTRRIK